MFGNINMIGGKLQVVENLAGGFVRLINNFIINYQKKQGEQLRAEVSGFYHEVNQTKS